MQFRNIKEELIVTKFRKKIEREIENYFEDKDFFIIEPKVFQEYDDFINSDIIKDSSKTVKVLGRDSKIYVLRPDITTNILSQIFSKWEGEPPLKVYYNSKTYRNSSRGEILQNYQMGVESLGDKVSKGDGEIIEMAVSILRTLEEPYILEIGSSKFIDALFEEINLDITDEREIRDLISKKNQDELKLKLKRIKLSNPILENIITMQGKIEEVIKKVGKYKMNREMKSALENLNQIDRIFKDENIKDRIIIDLSMVPELDYYDGIIFKGYSINIPNKILSGGRYDKSTAKYGKKVTAIGFMIDMDLVTQIRMKEMKK